MVRLPRYRPILGGNDLLPRNAKEIEATLDGGLSIVERELAALRALIKSGANQVSGYGTANNLTMFTSPMAIGDAPGFSYSAGIYTITGKLTSGMLKLIPDAYATETNSITVSNNTGLQIRGFAGSINDLTIQNAAGTVLIKNQGGSNLDIPVSLTTAAITASGSITGNATGSGTSSAFIASAASSPTMTWVISGAGVNEKNWDIQGGATTLAFRTRTDANASGTDWLTVTRSGTSISSIAFTGVVTISSTLSVGTTTNAAIALFVSPTTLTGTGQYAAQFTPTCTALATSLTGIYVGLNTVAAAYTVANVYGTRIDAPIKGAGSAITNLYGLKIENQSAGSVNYSLFTGTGATVHTDRVCVGPAISSVTQMFSVEGVAFSTGSSQYGAVVQPIFQSSATANITAIYAEVQTQNASYTVTNAYGIRIDVPIKGALNTITNLYGLRIENQSVGGTTNFAISTGTGIVRFGDTTDASNSGVAGVLIDGGVGILKGTWSASWFGSEVTLKNSFIINSSGVNFGFISNTAANEWALAYGTTHTTLGTAALKWNSSGIVSLPGTTDSTSIATGTLVVSGGIGVAKRLTLDGASGKTLRIVNSVANAAVAVTLGAGPTGSTAGNPQGWVRIDINGTDRYFPFW